MRVLVIIDQHATVEACDIIVNRRERRMAVEEKNLIRGFGWSIARLCYC
jgi:hypothetical protein